MVKDLSEEIVRIQDIFIETLGNMTHTAGDRRLMGRVIGLLFADNSVLSLTDIAARLRVSKPAVSNVINNVERRGIVERVYNPEKPRSAFFRLREKHWEFAMEQMERTTTGLMDLAGTMIEEMDTLRNEFGDLPEEFNQFHMKVKRLISIHLKLIELVKQFREICADQEDEDISQVPLTE